ncbi:MAG: sugar transferase, partial [Mesorhizobium sp.]
RHYVENWSLFEDVRIIIKTVPAVWMSRGSY